MAKFTITTKTPTVKTSEASAPAGGNTGAASNNKFKVSLVSGDKIISNTSTNANSLGRQAVDAVKAQKQAVKTAASQKSTVSSAADTYAKGISSLSQSTYGLSAEDQTKAVNGWLSDPGNLTAAKALYGDSVNAGHIIQDIYRNNASVKENGGSDTDDYYHQLAAQNNPDRLQSQIDAAQDKATSANKTARIVGGNKATNNNSRAAYESAKAEADSAKATADRLTEIQRKAQGIDTSEDKGGVGNFFSAAGKLFEGSTLKTYGLALSAGNKVAQSTGTAAYNIQRVHDLNAQISEKQKQLDAISDQNSLDAIDIQNEIAKLKTDRQTFQDAYNAASSGTRVTAAADTALAEGQNYQELALAQAKTLSTQIARSMTASMGSGVQKAATSASNAIADTLVKAGISGVQMVMDRLASPLTPLGSMAVRSFGSGYSDGEAKGFTSAGSFALGLVNAFVETGTELLFGGNPLEEGEFVGLVPKLAEKFFRNGKVNQFLSSVPMDILGEGIEEFIATPLEAWGEQLVSVKDPNVAAEKWDDIVGTGEWMQETFIGLLMGGFGSVVQTGMDSAKLTSLGREYLSAAEDGGITRGQIINAAISRATQYGDSETVKFAQRVQDAQTHGGVSDRQFGELLSRTAESVRSTENAVKRVQDLGRSEARITSTDISIITSNPDALAELRRGSGQSVNLNGLSRTNQAKVIRQAIRAYRESAASEVNRTQLSTTQTTVRTALANNGASDAEIGNVYESLAGLMDGKTDTDISKIRNTSAIRSAIKALTGVEIAATESGAEFQEQVRQAFTAARAKASESAQTGAAADAQVLDSQDYTDTVRSVITQLSTGNGRGVMNQAVKYGFENAETRANFASAVEAATGYTFTAEDMRNRANFKNALRKAFNLNKGENVNETEGTAEQRGPEERGKSEHQERDGDVRVGPEESATGVSEKADEAEAGNQRVSGQVGERSEGTRAPAKVIFSDALDGQEVTLVTETESKSAQNLKKLGDKHGVSIRRFEADPAGIAASEGETHRASYSPKDQVINVQTNNEAASADQLGCHEACERLNAEGKLDTTDVYNTVYARMSPEGQRAMDYLADMYTIMTVSGERVEGIKEMVCDGGGVIDQIGFLQATSKTFNKPSVAADCAYIISELRSELESRIGEYLIPMTDMEIKAFGTEAEKSNGASGYGAKYNTAHGLEGEPGTREKAAGQTVFSSPFKEDLMTNDGEDTSAPVFYSRMQKIIDAPWKQYMNKDGEVKSANVVNYLKKMGVKNEEIKWSGIEAWLDEQGDTVTQEQLSQFARDSQIHIVKKTRINYDTSRRESLTNVEKARLDAASDKAAQLRIDLVKNVWDPIVNAVMGRRVLPPHLYDEYADPIAYIRRKILRYDTGVLYDDYAALTYLLGTKPLAEDFTPKEVADIIRDAVGDAEDNSAFMDYIHFNDGNDDLISLVDKYRNDLETTLKEKFSDDDLKQIAEAADLVKAAKDEYDRVEADVTAAVNARSPAPTKWETYSTEGITNYREYEFMLPGNDYSNRSMDTHWNDQGVLAHARVGDMTASDGGKVLFIDEIQSDWANAGRKLGFAERGMKEKIAQLREEHQAIEDKIDATVEERWAQSGKAQEAADIDKAIAERRESSDELVGTSGPFGFPAFDYDLDALESKRDELRMDYRRLEWQVEDEFPEKTTIENQIALLERQSETPDMPYRDDYYQFVLKALIREAAENGYAYIAWTTARQQANRGDEDYIKGYRVEYDNAIPNFLKKYIKQWNSYVTDLDLGLVKNTDRYGHIWEITLQDQDERETTLQIEANSYEAAEDIAEFEAQIRSYGDEELTVTDIRKDDHYKQNQGIVVTPAMVRSALFTGQEQYSSQFDESKMNRTGNIGNSADPYDWMNGGRKKWPISDEQRRTTAGYRSNRVGVQYPRYDMNGARTSKTLQTLANAGCTTDEFEKALESFAANGEGSHMVYTDRKALDNMKKRIADPAIGIGWENAYASFKQDVEDGKTSKDITVTGILLYNNAIDNDDITGALDIVNLLIQNSNSAASAMQAMRILSKVGPEGQLYNAIRGIETIAYDMRKRYGLDESIVIDNQLLSEYRDALMSKDEDRIADTWADIARVIADQMPGTWTEKFNNWRYLAMLGNTRTHIRNIVGNAGFAPVRLAKQGVKAGLEHLVIGATGTEGRTTAVLNPFSADDRQLIAVAWNDYVNVMDLIQNGDKFDHTSNDIEKNRTIYKHLKNVEGARKINSNLLDAEDTWFSRPAYAEALASYLKANGLDAARFADWDTVDRDYSGISSTTDGRATGENLGHNMTEEAFQAARTYAIEEARKATYRDVNAFSEAVSKLGRIGKNADANGIAKATGMVIEGVLPFKKTPANILVRAVEYSPIELLGILGHDIKAVRTGQMTTAAMLDHIASGATGSAILGLGILLAHLGVLHGADDPDDDRQNDFNALQGQQEWSLDVGGYNITLDWLAPEVMPLFLGASVYSALTKQYTDDGQSTPAGILSALLDALPSIVDPMLSLSMLSSVEDMLENLQYVKNGRALSSIIGSAVTSYASQYLPTFFGQIERIMETERQTTFQDKNSDLSSSAQYALGKALNKVPIPGAEYNQVEYMDAWGRTDPSGNVLERIISNMAAPFYYNKDSATENDTELQRLYDAGFSDVLPTKAKQSTTVDQQYLTADEYVTYLRTRGNESLQGITDLLQSEWYKSATDEQKASAIEDVYDSAAELAEDAVRAMRGVETSGSRTATASKAGMSVQTLVVANGIYNNATTPDGYNTTSAGNTPGWAKALAVISSNDLSSSEKLTYINMIYNGSTDFASLSEAQEYYEKQKAKAKSKK